MSHLMNKRSNSEITNDNEEESKRPTAATALTEGMGGGGAVKLSLVAYNDDDDFIKEPPVDATSAPGSLTQLINIARNRDSFETARELPEQINCRTAEMTLLTLARTRSEPMPALSVTLPERQLQNSFEFVDMPAIECATETTTTTNDLLSDELTTTTTTSPATATTIRTSSSHGTEENCNQTTDVDESADGYCLGGYHPVVIGEVLGKRYHVLRKLGWGHFSTVWLCWDAKVERYCAAKIVKSAEHFSETARDEILLLQSIAATQYHSYCPHRMRLIELFDSFKVNGPNGTHHCLIFELLGDNLLTLIQRSQYRGLPLNNVKQIARQILEGLDYLHTKCNIIHTDLKPENVLLVPDDLQIRTQANEAAGEFLRLNVQQQQSNRPSCQRRYSTSMPDDFYKCLKSPHRACPQKLSKSQKKRCRAKIKRSINFFRLQRALLRDRGIDDLLLLAQHGLLTPSIVVSAITDQLGFMSFDDLQLLCAEDIAMLERHASMEQVGDTPKTLVACVKATRRQAKGDNMTTQAKNRTKAKLNKASRMQQQQQQRENAPQVPFAECSDMVKLIMSAPEKFLIYAKERVKEHDALNGLVQNKRQRSANRKYTSSSPSFGRYKRHRYVDVKRSNAPPRKPCASKMSELSKDLNAFQTYGPNLLDRKDPATQTCNMSVKVADMGNGCWRYHHFTDDIQTREYRAIEVILGAGYDTSADIWSAGCLLWELATGDYLFDPQFSRTTNQDESHVAHIMELCGSIPAEMILFGEYADEIFDYKGNLRNVKNLQQRDLTQILIDGYFWHPERAHEFTDFLRPMLCVDPKKRITAADALQQRWLKINEEQSKY